MHTELAVQVVEDVEQGAPLGLEDRGELGDEQRGGDAILVAHEVGGDAVAEGLLVAVVQPLDAGDPLEAGERLLVRHPGQTAHRGEQARADDGVGHPASFGDAAHDQVRGEQDAELVAAQQPPAAVDRGVGNGHGAAVGIGVVGDDEVWRGRAGSRQGGVERAVLLGVGEGDGGEVGVRRGLLGDLGRRGEAGPLEGPLNRRVADPVERGVQHGEVARGVEADDSRDGVEVGLEHFVAEDLPAGLGARHRRDARDLVDLRRDLRIARRHDLAAVAEVDLVAVVLRRVVARGDHDARVGAEVPDGEGEHRRRQRLRQQHRAPAGGGDDRRRVDGEGVGVVPRVATDDDEGSGARLLQVGHEARGGADDDGPVHAMGAGAEGAAQAGGAELEQPGEAVGEVGDGSRVTPFGSGDDRQELLPGRRVGVVGSPLARGGEQVVGDVGGVAGGVAHGRPQILATMLARRVPHRSAAA